MAATKTYLMVPPANEKGDYFGRGISAWEIIAKLARINPMIRASEPVSVQASVLTPSDPGITCLWLASDEGLKKITAMRLGIVPEFTQMSPDGMEVCKGWRAVFEKVVASRAASRGQIEKAFGVTLELVDNSLLCKPCLKRGQRRLHRGGVLRACSFHERIYKASQDYLKAREALKRGEDVSISF